jgi:hypothetical protein
MYVAASAGRCGCEADRYLIYQPTVVVARAVPSKSRLHVIGKMIGTINPITLRRETLSCLKYVFSTVLTREEHFTNRLLYH